MKYRIRSEVLDKIREEQNLSSDEALAHHLGISVRAVQGLRKGRQPSLPTFVRVMEAANITRIGAGIAAAA